MRDQFFKTSMTFVGLGMAMMLLAVFMFLIERGAPHQAWVAVVGSTSMIGAGVSMLFAVGTAVASVWAK